MGCTTSKLDDLQALAHCRRRCDLIDQAITDRFALANAHRSYADSLKSVGIALHRVLDNANQDISPVLAIPGDRKGDPPPPPAISGRSRSHSGSHIHFHSDNSDSDDISPLHSDGDSPPPHLRYARSNPPPPSVSVEQRIGSPEQVQYVSAAAGAYGYPNYYGFFGAAYPPVAAGANSKASTSRAVASPPRTSAWDFLNPFEGSDSYYRSYSPSRSSKEVREDEGIPDLEEDEQEVIKEAYGDQKFVGLAAEPSDRSAAVERDDVGGRNEDDVDVVVVEKNVVDHELQKGQEVRRSVGGGGRRYRNVAEVASEIRVQFEGAAELTKEVAKMLEVGKHPYSSEGCASAVSSRMLCVIPVSLSKDEDLVYVEDKVMRSGNLSSTLHKLKIWERKLLDEVRVEEKLRLLHDRKTKKLQHLDKGGAEAHKIDATEKLIRKLSTQIMIAFQVVNSISTKINELRDAELWPQIYELIQGLERMWKDMVGCHQIQYQAISEASYIDSIASGGRLSDSVVNAMRQLEVELLRWIDNFTAWINFQRDFVKSMNAWLVLCLRYEPEETADGIPPYSPGRIGAPPVFGIFNSWSQALDRVSEKEVLDALRAFASNLNRIWQPYDIEFRQKMLASREMEKSHKARERETQVINKELEALQRKHVATSAPQNELSLSQPSQPASLQSALRHAFGAMEGFSTNLTKAYEDIHARADEEKAKVKSSQD